MKIVHFECGFGNQLTCFANYLLVKKNNPHDQILVEDLIYRIERGDIGINQWNGFEIEKVFGLSLPRAIDVVEDKEKLLGLMREEFLKNKGHFNSRSAFMALTGTGINCVPACAISSKEQSLFGVAKKKLNLFLVSPSKNRFSYNIKKTIYRCLRIFHRDKFNLFRERKEHVFYPLSFEVMKNRKLIDEVREELYRCLCFPPFSNPKNKKLELAIKSTNSVSIHARRSDFLQYNSDCYKYGFFKKAVRYIKKRVKSPSFYIFSDDSEWCLSNLGILGLDQTKDNVFFVDWNKGSDSYCDMQLMSMCKHNIITKSSFGWWAAFLNKNENKIVCSQISEYFSYKSF